MSEVQHRLARQAKWQRARKGLSWPEKIRMVEAIRESVLGFGAIRAREQAQRVTEKERPAGSRKRSVKPSPEN